LLLLNAGEVVSSDRLIDELWAGNPPKAAVSSLQNLISDLRKALGRDVVQTRQPGYVLDISAEQVDLHHFERLVAQTSTSGEPERRAELLREALGLWRGPPLADLAFEAFASVEIARLEELRTAAREELIEAELELGHHSQVVPELEALVTEHPLRERLRGQLMLALYRSGRQAEALEAYRQARETLVDELGIEPSTELQRLEQSILRHDSDLDLPDTADVAQAAAAEERRKTATLLFADIVDSSRLGAILDPEVLRSVMRRYFDTVRTIVERHEGTIEKFIGDAAMAVFGVPRMHEDDALRALRAATELREALTVLNTDLKRDHALELQVRIGINSGEVLAGDSAAGQPFATGAAVNVAMRLQQAALPDETLLGEATMGLVRDAAEVEPVESIDVGPPLGPYRAFRLLAVGERVARSPSGASFIGREAPLAQLTETFRRVCTDRRARIVVVLGEAGIGKTRLASELLHSLGAEADSLVGRCVSYGEGATYLPLAEIMRQLAPERPQAMIARLLEGDEHAALVGERMAELLGQSDGTAPTNELFWAVRRLFAVLARRRPTVVVLEDLHWAEPTLLDLVEYLATWPVEDPLLVVCLSRPELRDKRPTLSSAGDVIKLEPLPDEQVEALVGELGGADVTAEARKRIARVAEGNPLFAEQLLAYLDEAGADALEAVPPTVEALLSSRLDRLDPEERSLLERAAVVGREFAHAAVVNLTPPDELAAVDGRLRSLARRGLIHAVRGADHLRFHHILIRDVAYAAITKHARSLHHERYANWLEGHEQHAEEIVGYHLEQAYGYRSELLPSDPELPDLAQRAGSQLGTAGIRAWKRADTAATINLLTRSTTLLPAGDSSRAELLCELGIAQGYAGEIEAGAATLEQAIESGSGPVELRARIELANARLFSDPDSRASDLLDLAAKAIPLFEEVEDDRALGRTWRHVGYVRGGMQSRHEDWRRASEQALVHYLRAGWSPSGCLVGLAASLYYGPVPATDAIARCNELLEDATERVSRAHILVFLGGLVSLDGRIDEGRGLLDEASVIYEELSEPYARANNAWRILGHIELLAANFTAAEAIFRECCALFEQARDQAALSSLSSELGQSLYAQDRLTEAGEAARVAEESAPRDDVPAQFAWRAVKAKLLARAESRADAHSLALEAVALSDSTDSPCQRADVLLDLAEVNRLSDQLGDAAEAVERALRLFDAKGDVTSAERARGLLDELAVV
jgi:class 3 adenylate cyclase